MYMNTRKAEIVLSDGSIIADKRVKSTILDGSKIYKSKIRTLVVLNIYNTFTIPAYIYRDEDSTLFSLVAKDITGLSYDSPTKRRIRCGLHSLRINNITYDYITIPDIPSHKAHTVKGYDGKNAYLKVRFEIALVIGDSRSNFEFDKFEILLLPYCYCIADKDEVVLYNEIDYKDTDYAIKEATLRIMRENIR